MYTLVKVFIIKKLTVKENIKYVEYLYCIDLTIEISGNVILNNWRSN